MEPIMTPCLSWLMVVFILQKEKGKDRFIIYTPEIHGDLINRDTKLRNLHIGANFMKPIDKLEMIAKF